MKNIISLLTLFDIYGTKYHFLIHQNLIFKTWKGGIITLILSFIGLIFIYLFGQDFFFRRNPTYTFSSIGEGYKIINLTDEKFVLAFRIEDEYGYFYNSSKIFPKIYYYSAIPGEDGQYRSNYVEKYIPYRKCTDRDFEGNDNYISLYGDMYCIEWEDIKFGGYWDNEYLYYFEIRLFYCKNGEDYSFNRSICPSIEELNEYFNSKSIYFSLYYTTIEFRVNELNHPLSRKHANYFTELSFNFRKNDRIFIHEQILNDDQGWLISSYKNISIWGINNLKSDYQYYENKLLNRTGFSSKFYTLNIYMTPEKNYYTRKYMKIQDVLSMIGGLFTCFNLIGQKISYSMNINMKKFKIIENFFDFEEDIETEKNKKLNNNNINSISKLINYSNSNIMNKNSNMEKDNENKNNIQNKILLSYHSSTNLNNKNKKLSNKNVLFGNFVKKKMKSNKMEVKQQYQNQKNFYRLNIIDKKGLKKQFCCFNNKKDIYDKLYNEKNDIFNYFYLLKDVNILKEITLNQKQILAIKFLKKININMYNDLYDISNNQNKINKVINYFKNIFKSKNNSNIDDLIYRDIENEIKNKIK